MTGKDNENIHICGDDCEHSLENEHATVTLTLEDNSKLECIVLGTFDVDDNEYIAVVPVDSDEAFIYKFIQHEDDEIELSSIESEEEFEKVSEAFYTIFDDDQEDEE